MPIPAGSGSGPAPDGLSYDPVLSRVRLSVWVPPVTIGVIVDRSTDGVRWTTVRGANELATPGGGQVSISDYEFAPGVSNTYRLRAYAAGGVELGPALNANPYFEVDASDWVIAGGGSVARSTTQAHQGVASLLVTPDGVASSAEARAEYVPATAGQPYRAYAWVRCAASRTVGVGINWYQSVGAGGAFISQSLASTAVVANTWTLLELSATAPALTGQARMLVGMASTPTVGHTLHIDEAMLVRVGGRVFTGAITPAMDGVWLKSLARPFLNRAVVVRDYSEVTRRSRAGVFDVKGRSAPVAVTDVRSSRQWTLDVNTYSEQERSDLDLLLASGDILLVHVPPNAGRISTTPGGYVAVGDTKETTLPTAELANRVFSLPMTEVAAPGPDVVGGTSTWQSVLNTYASWADVMAAHSTWADLLELIGDPTEVIVS